jgi:predicted small lipoprotein YifL
VSRRTHVTGIVVTLVLVTLAGCGRRGPLESPRGGHVEQPAPAMLVPAPSINAEPAASKQSLLPAPTTTAAGASEWQDPASSKEVLQVPAHKKGDPKPKRSFFLDPLL